MKIEKNVQIPKNNGDATRKYPFNEMSVGDSFLCPSEVASKEKVRTAAWQYGKVHGVKFTTRSEDGGTRIWRIE